MLLNERGCQSTSAVTTVGHQHGLPDDRPPPSEEWNVWRVASLPVREGGMRREWWETKQALHLPFLMCWLLTNLAFPFLLLRNFVLPPPPLQKSDMLSLEMPCVFADTSLGGNISY